MAAKIDSFKQLLNEISHELTEKNLQSLIHLSNVRGACQSSIKDGHALFTYLLHDGLISADNVGYLRDLLRKMRPRRPALVVLLDDYIKRKHNVDDISLILGELSDSGEVVRSPAVTEESSGHSSVVFRLECDYISCVCRKFPCIPLIIITLLALICTIVIWYADVPKISKHINSDEDLKKAGIYIIMVEIIVFLMLCGYLVQKKCLRARRGYNHFANDSIQQRSREIVPADSPTYASTMPVAATGQAGPGNPTEPRVYRISMGYGSYSGPESAVFSYTSSRGNSLTDEAADC